MKDPLALTILGLVAVGLVAGTFSAGTREGSVQAAEGKSLDPQEGDFHKLHGQTLELGCTDCHSPGAQDILFLRKDEPLPAGMPGPVNREVCLSCHQAPAQPTWYGARPR